MSQKTRFPIHPVIYKDKKINLYFRMRFGLVNSLYFYLK